MHLSTPSFLRFFEFIQTLSEGTVVSPGEGTMGGGAWGVHSFYFAVLK